MTSIDVQENKPLKEVCTFGIGGCARYFIEVQTQEEAQAAILFAKERHSPFHVLGKGSNTLFDDRGFSGVVILNKISFCKEISTGVFHTGGGYSFSLLGTQTAKKGWKGLEFAAGIPGTVGGAIFMNAGANGGETKDTLASVDFVDAAGVLHTLTKEDLSFGYRTSPFQERPGIITAATFSLKAATDIRQQQLKILEYRKKTQPYADKSAGCAFRNPQAFSAGYLIEKAGLKGACMGDAKVSEKHANFIVNSGQATAQDVLRLIAHIRSAVQESSHIELESEVRYIPYAPNE